MLATLFPVWNSEHRCELFIIYGSSTAVSNYVPLPRIVRPGSRADDCIGMIYGDLLLGFHQCQFEIEILTGERMISINNDIVISDIGNSCHQGPLGGGKFQSETDFRF